MGELFSRHVPGHVWVRFGITTSRTFEPGHNSMYAGTHGGSDGWACTCCESRTGRSTMGDARQTLDQAMTEKTWQQTIIDLAHTLGWLTYHTHDSRRSQPGFPDLVLVRDRIVYAELKDMRRRLTTAQFAWLDDLRRAGGEAYVWRPSDWPQAKRILNRRGRP
jgi:VRR-NUC domain